MNLSRHDYMTAGEINFSPNCFWDVNPLHSPRGRGFFFYESRIINKEFRFEKFDDISQGVKREALVKLLKSLF